MLKEIKIKHSSSYWKLSNTVTSADPSLMFAYSCFKTKQQWKSRLTNRRHHRVAASNPFYLSRSVRCRNQQLQQQRGNRFIRCARFLHCAQRSPRRYCASVLRVVGRHGGLRDGEPVGYACTPDDRQATLQERLPIRSGSLHPYVWLARKPGFLRRFKRRKFLEIV